MSIRELVHYYALPQLGGAALDDGELHTRLPHPSIQLQYGLVLDLGLGTMCVPVPNIVIPPVSPYVRTET